MGEPLQLGESVSAQSIRIRVTAASGGQARITEIEAWE
jgi:hypothetical protein